MGISLCGGPTGEPGRGLIYQGHLLPMAKKNSYYHKHTNYQDCLHSAAV